MRDHKVVVMPDSATLGRQVRVAEFAASQRTKTPLPRRASTPGNSRQQGSSIFRSNSPGKRPVSRSRDIVQEVYDRMGVNYVRGQNSIELYDSTSAISISSLTTREPHSPERDGAGSSIVSRLPGVYGHDEQRRESKNGELGIQKPLSISVDTRHEYDEKEEERFSYRSGRSVSIRSTRSVKSMLSVFSGGRSEVSNMTTFSAYKAPHKIVTSTQETIDVRNDEDVDMSVVSIEDSQWTNKQQQEVKKKTPTPPFSRSSSFQNSRIANSSKNVTTPAKSAERDEEIERLVEEKLQAKIAELTESFEAKIRQMEAETNKRLEKMEAKLKALSKEESLQVAAPNRAFSYQKPRERHSFSYGGFRL